MWFLAKIFQLKEVRLQAIKVVLNKNARTTDRLTALTIVKRAAEISDIALIEGLINDEAKIEKSFRKESETPLGDMVLAAVIWISGQDKEDYKMKNYWPGTLGRKLIKFDTPEDRIAAHKKWKTWWKENKGKITIVPPYIPTAKECEDFIAGKSEPIKQYANSWARYKAVIDDTPEHRAFFVEMLKDSNDLLAIYESNPTKCNDYFETVYAEVSRGDAAIHTLYRTAAAALVISDKRVDYINGGGFLFLIHNFKNEKELQKGGVVNKLVEDIVTNSKMPEGLTESGFIRSMWTLSEVHKLERTKAWAIELAHDEKMRGFHRASFLEYLGNNGTADDIAAIEKLVDSDVGLWVDGKGKGLDTRLGDTALVAVLKLSGQSQRGYNIKTSKYEGKGFKKEADRVAARKKWRASREKK